MLAKESTANWQMHQLLMFIVDQVYCEYIGFEVRLLNTYTRSAVTGLL